MMSFLEFCTSVFLYIKHSFIVSVVVFDVEYVIAGLPLLSDHEVTTHLVILGQYLFSAR